MTEALSQNLENNLEAAFEMLNVSTAISTDASQTTDGEAFSNLINTISANLEQAQSEFETLAADGVLLDSSVKSNISSINQFVLEDKTLEIEGGLELDPETITFDDVNLDNIDNKIEIVEPEIVIQETKQETTDAKKEEVKTDEVLITNYDILNKTNDLAEIKTTIENDFSNLDSVESIEKLSSSIDNVLALLDETNLSIEEKNSIKDAFKKVQKLIEKAKNSLQEEQNAVSDEAKKTLDGIILKLVSKTTNTETKEDYTVETIDIEELKAVVKQSQMIASDDLSNDIQSALKDAANALQETVEAVYNNDTKTLKTSIETLQISLDELSSALDGQETNNEEIIELNKKLTQALEVLNKNTSLDTEDSNKLQQLNEEIKINLDNFNLFKPEEKQEVLSLLEKFKDSSTLNKEEKLQVENIINKINNLPQANKILGETVKKETNENFSTKILNEFDEILPEQKVDNKKLEINLNTAKKENKVEVKTSINNSVEPIKTQKTDQKTDSLIEKISDEMVVEAKISKIPMASGALSVNDEVAKMALNEETSSVLSATDAPIQANIMYDNGVVKNNSIQLKDIPAPKFNPAEHNVMNQITDKITELKGSEGHKLTLVLRPNDLGRVSIELKTDANGLTTHIVAQNAEVRNFIEKNIHNLRQSLSDSGVNVNNIQIKTAGEAESSTYEGNKDFNQQQQEQQEQSQNKNQNQKERKETLQAFSDFETQFKKDFSSVLNKTISYNLN